MKLTLLAGAAIGYVLGAKAGRQRYEQIMGRAKKTWSSEPVQSKIDTATQAVKARAPELADKVGEAAKHVESKVKGKIGKGKGSDRQDAEHGHHSRNDGKVLADVSGFGPQAKDESP